MIQQDAIAIKRKKNTIKPNFVTRDFIISAVFVNMLCEVLIWCLPMREKTTGVSW